MKLKVLAVALISLFILAPVASAVDLSIDSQAEFVLERELAEDVGTLESAWYGVGLKIDLGLFSITPKVYQAKADLDNNLYGNVKVEDSLGYGVDLAANVPVDLLLPCLPPELSFTAVGSYKGAEFDIKDVDNLPGSPAGLVADYSEWEYGAVAAYEIGIGEIILTPSFGVVRSDVDVTAITLDIDADKNWGFRPGLTAEYGDFILEVIGKVRDQKAISGSLTYLF